MSYINIKDPKQLKEFEELYKKYWEYVFKYEVRYPDDFESDKYPYDKETFKQDIEENGMMIKIYEGY